MNRLDTLRKILKAYEEECTCTRAKVAALIIREGRVISTGYAGAPSGLPHCTDVGCEIGPDGGCIRTVHAEANAIAFAAKYGITTNDCGMLVSIAPCLSCAKLIINSGIDVVWYIKPYRDNSGIELLEKAGVRVIELNEQGVPLV